MSDDNKFDLTRRKALGGLGGIGAGAALGGTGTMAFLNDTESSTGNTVTAGELDLKIDWEEHYNGEEVKGQKLTNNPGPIFELGDLKPGDYGEATISLHVFNNPAWVHMGGELTKNAENGVNDPENEAEGEDDTLENQGDDWSGELADEILVDVWYDGSDADADGEGGNNVYESDELPIASGTLRDVMAQLEDGRLLRNQAPAAGNVDAASTADTGAACATSDDWKIDATPEVGDTTQNGEVEITGVERETEANEVVGVEWKTTGDAEVCLVAVKGGPATETYPYDCATTGGVDYSPENTGNQNRTYYEISNVQFYYCENGDDDNGNGSNGDNNGHHDDCWPNSTTQYIGFSWELPFEVGNEIQSDEVRFDLQFHAQQCRHNDDPPNPYAE